MALVSGSVMLALLGTAAAQILQPIIGGKLSLAPPVITFIRQSTFNIAVACTTCTGTITAPSSGHTLIAFFANADNVRAVNSVSLTGSSGWARAIRAANATNGCALDIWFGAVGAGAGTSLSATMSASTNAFVANVTEWSGVAASPLDGSGSISGGTTSPGATAAYSTGTANDLVTASIILSTTGITVSSFPSGYTQLTSLALSSCNMTMYPGYLLPAPAGAQSATWTWTPSAANYSNAIIGFKP